MFVSIDESDKDIFIRFVGIPRCAEAIVIGNVGDVDPFYTMNCSQSLTYLDVNRPAIFRLKLL